MTREELLNEARNNPDSEIYQMMQRIYKWQEKQHIDFEEHMRKVKDETEK